MSNITILPISVKPSWQSKLESSFVLPPYIIDHCEKYYVLHWSGDYLASEIHRARIDYETISTMIQHQDVTYKVIFLETPHVFESEAQYKLSFRKLANTDTGYVLIKKADKS